MGTKCYPLNHCIFNESLIRALYAGIVTAAKSASIGSKFLSGCGLKIMLDHQMPASALSKASFADKP